MEEDNIHSATTNSYYGAGVEAAAKAYLNSVCCKSIISPSSRQPSDTNTTFSVSPPSGLPTDTKSKSKYFSPERKYTKMAITPKKKNIKYSKSESVKSIRLVKQKTIVKSRMFMNSPNSIYAAVSTQYRIDGSDLANLPSLEDILLIIYIHFGGCKIFEDSFDTIINSEECLSLDLIERALNDSVRHLCANECYLRAFHGIREFTFLWRDLVSDNDVNKAELLQGWCCKIQPPMLKDNTKSKDQKRRRLPLIYVSPCGREFNTKTKVINYMNKKMSTSSSFDKMTPKTSTSTKSTQLINITNDINSLYSPFGLIEELYIDNPWKFLVSTICLNVTTRAQLDTGELY